MRSLSYFSFIYRPLLIFIINRNCYFNELAASFFSSSSSHSLILQKKKKKKLKIKKKEKKRKAMKKRKKERKTEEGSVFLSYETMRADKRKATTSTYAYKQ
jgi:mannitol-specific phosphotransferase system IIBC component